jgi:protocatechuate 3,4-dioxygenase beta subunit
MSFSAPRLSAVLLTILSLSASLCAQSATTPAAKVTLGSISGRITLKDKGVAGVPIGLRKGDVYTPFEGYQRTTTDQDGFYHISNLAPGSYSIIVSAPAFVIPDLWSNKQKAVLVGEGENVEGVNFALVRGGVITGRVTDADGRPVIEQQVNVYPAAMYEQKVQRTIYATGSAQTDDRGIYRVFGLAPGRYKVAVGRSDGELNVTGNQWRNVSYKQVFYPDATDQAKATIVEVGEENEANDINITVGRMVQTFTASGLLVDETGQPVPKLRFGLIRQIGDRIEYTSSSTTTNNSGEFVTEGLVPGKYTVFLFGDQNGLRAKPFNFDIVDRDLTELTVKVTKGASISGIVVLENQDKTILAKLLQLQLLASGIVSIGNGGTFAITTRSPLGPDGSFHLSSLPTGTINMSLLALGMPLPPKGFTITHIERDGIVSARGLEVKDAEQVTGVRVFVSFGTAILRGVVTVDNGPLPEKGRIFARLIKQGDPLPNFRPPVFDERGRFLMEGIPAGRYQFELSVSLPQSAPRYIKREVILQDGQTTDVTINIEP